MADVKAFIKGEFSLEELLLSVEDTVTGKSFSPEEAEIIARLIRNQKEE